MPKIKPFNNYRIEGNIVYIELITKDNILKETMINLEDLELVKSYGDWHLSYYKHGEQYYVTHSLRFIGEDGKRHGTTIHLHKNNFKSKERRKCRSY